MDKKYEAIIDLPRPTSQRLRMPRHQRAAQFAPFAALTGYEGVLAEVARQTEEETELDESEISAINEKLCLLKGQLERRPGVQMRVFYPDQRKSGGHYDQIEGRLVKIDEYRRKLWLEDGRTVFFRQIISLDIP